MFLGFQAAGCRQWVRNPTILFSDSMVSPDVPAAAAGVCHRGWLAKPAAPERAVDGVLTPWNRRRTDGARAWGEQGTVRAAGVRFREGWRGEAEEGGR